MRAVDTHKDWYTWFQATIQCPFCGEHNHDRTDYPRSLQYDGDHTRVECPDCEREFTVTMCVEYTYSTKP